jgi:hypothetical protein
VEPCSDSFQAASATQPHRSITRRGWATASLSSLHEIDIGFILGVEQIDVRRILLADSPTAPIWSAAILLIFDFPISIFQGIFHGRIDVI